MPLRIGDAVNRLRGSKFAQQAALIFVLTLVSRCLAFLGTAYAARCLGPTYLGISALVLVTTRQVALLYDGGLNVVGIRKIAADKENSRAIIETINSFQLSMAVVTAIVWVICVFLLVPADQHFAWALGAPLLLLSATAILFVFQGLEKLPVQAAISSVSSLLTAGAYFLFFYPGIFLGADLLVTVGVGLFGTVAAWGIYYRIFGRLPIGKLHRRQIFTLLRESWRYWILAVVVFFYSSFQIPLIAELLGDRETGIYRSAFLMAAGLGILFDSINSLLLARMVAWKKQGLCVMWRKQSQLFLILLGIGVLPVVFLILVAPFIYQNFLGESFMDGILVFQILIVGRLVVFLGQTYAWGLVANAQDNQLLVATLLGSAVSVTMSLLLIPEYGILAAACISVAVEILVHAYCYFVLKEKVRKFHL